MSGTLHYGLTFEEYRALPGLNWSVLKHMDKTPAHCRAAMDSDRSASREMVKGSVADAMLTNPTAWADRFLIVPKCDRRTKDGKAEWAAYEDQAAATGRTLVLEDDATDAAMMHAAMMAHPTVRALVEDPVTHWQVAVTWQDDETGVLCKGLLDGWSPSFIRTLIEVKSSGEVDPATWGRVMDNWMYHGQLAWYWRGLVAAGERPEVIRMIAAENKPPYSVIAPRVGDATLAAGMSLTGRLLRRYAACEKAGKWPGWPTADFEVDVPDYALSREGGML